MCDEIQPPARVSPLDRLVAAQKELNASIKASQFPNIVCRSDGFICVGSAYFDKAQAKQIALDILKLLGEDD